MTEITSITSQNDSFALSGEGQQHHESEYFTLTSLVLYWSPQDRMLTPKERAFYEQKAAFLSIRPLFLSQYGDKYVASMNGEIIDSDNDLATLSSRFFQQHGDVPVYITKVGSIQPESVVTPFFQ
jgi:hypothetical protein